MNWPAAVLAASLRWITTSPPARFDAAEQKVLDVGVLPALLCSDAADLAVATALIGGGATQIPSTSRAAQQV